MTIIQQELTSFFKKKYNAPFTPYTEYQQGFHFSSLDILLSEVKRKRAVNQFKVWDFINLENDPNYTPQSGVINKLLSKVVSFNSLSTVVQTHKYIAKIKEFLPTNVKQFLIDFNSLVDTNTNLLNIYDKGLPFKLIEQTLFQDLTNQYNNNGLSFDDIVSMYKRVETSFPILEVSSSSGIRPLLQLPLSNILIGDVLSIFDSEEYLNLIDEVFTDANDKTLFETDLRNEIVVYSKNTPEELLDDITPYENYTIDYNDPLALNIRQILAEQIKNNYEETIEILIKKHTNSEELINLFFSNYETIVNKTFTRGSIGLNSLFVVVDTLNKISYNNTIDAIKTSFNLFGEMLIKNSSVQLNYNPSTPPFDYLVRLKTNIQKRKEFKLYGTQSSNITALDDYFKSIKADGKITEDELDRLNTYMDSL